MKNLLSIIFSLIVLLFSIQSCGKSPLPCFSTLPEEDNIHVNQPVVFSAYCTAQGKEFYWQFYDNDDSIAFGPVQTKYFKDTGEVKVSLDATNGTKSSRYTKVIVVRP